MSQLLIKIISIGIKKIVFKSILYGGNHSLNFLNIMYSTHMKFNMPQKWLLFPSNKHKIFEMQKHKDNDNIPIKCKYCN
jgi:hypothetical protein